MQDKDLKRFVLEAVFEEDGRKKLRCSDAFRLAAEHGVRPEAVGRVCNQEGVRISDCQLGCFK